MYSIYTTAGQMAHLGPNGNPYTDEKAAASSAAERNSRAQQMGLKVRYEVRPAPVAEAA